MAIAYVQFSDATETKIISVFTNPQDPEQYPNQGIIEDSDQRYIDFFNPPIIGPTFPEAKELKRKEMRDACFNAIERTSFASAALGPIHNYDCRIVDQLNLKIRYDIALSQNSEEPIWASDGTRYEWKDHNAEELLDVMIDMNINIKAKQGKLVTKLALVDAAMDMAEVDVISWD